MKKLLAVVLSASFMMLAGAAFAEAEVVGKTCTYNHGLNKGKTCSEGTRYCKCKN